MWRLSPLLLVAQAATPWTLSLLDAQKYPLAKCLDGTQPGFYFSPGSGSGVANWVIHTQGGGWCTSDNDCAGRAKSALGSSSSWSSTGCDASTRNSAPVCYADGGFSGMISNSSATNPLLYNWNKVFINYCDGASYASARTDTITVGSQTLYYRGWHNLNGVYDELFASHNLGAAATVVIKGCSAGGLAVYLHVDYLREKINKVNPATRVVGAPGAGFFLGEANGYAKNSPNYLDAYKWVFSAGNMSLSVNSACLAAIPAEPWKCFIAPEILPYISTPVFICALRTTPLGNHPHPFPSFFRGAASPTHSLGSSASTAPPPFFLFFFTRARAAANSLSDAWQAGAIMGLGCNPAKAGNCNAAQMTYLQTFRAQMLSLLAPLTKAGSPHGGFLQGCFVHVVEDVSGWESVQVGGQTQSSTFSAWLTGAGGAPTVIDTFPPWSNPTC